jgi:large subunit ribosomal protein L10
MNRATKAEEIASISSKFAKSKAAFLVDFKGMSVEQVTSLRKTLTPLKAEMRVVRNTLAKRALMDHPAMQNAISDAFVGTNAIVFAYEDVSASAKALTEFAKDVEQLDVKTGVMEGTKLDKEKVKYLATLPSKDVLRAQLLGVLQAPAGKFVRTLNAVPSGFVRVLAAYQQTKQG